MALSYTFNNLPAVRPYKVAPISNEVYDRLIARGQQMYERWNTPPRQTLALGDFRYSPVAHGWLQRQEVLFHPPVEKPQPVEPASQPILNETYTVRPVAFHGWRKLAWYVIGLLDNVCHVGRVSA